MAEFPAELYPPSADFTREDILRQIFGDVGELRCGKSFSISNDLNIIVRTYLFYLISNLFFDNRFFMCCWNDHVITWSYVRYESISLFLFKCLWNGKENTYTIFSYNRNFKGEYCTCYPECNIHQNW